MTNLNTNLKLEDVKNNPALQGIECGLFWARNEYDNVNKYHLTKWLNQTDFENDKEEYLGIGISSYADVEVEFAVHSYPAPTIADIINNAEELFQFTEEDKLAWETQEKFICYMQEEILRMCQQDKTIEEISAYIISNLK